MNMDINIKKIINVYHSRNDNWKRDFFDTRLYNGIVLFDEGAIKYIFEDKKLVAKKGDFLFLPGNIPYSGKRLTDTVAFYVLDFVCDTDSEFCDVVGASVHTSNQYDAFCMKFAEAVAAWKKQYIDAIFKIKSFAYSVLCDAFGGNNKEKTQTDSILDYIYENISKPSLSLKKLCEKFFISESQIRRNIHKQTGMNPNDYILKLRINKAKYELTNSSKSIGEIAAGCGFSSPYYFSRCFSEFTGITPSKYRTLTFRL